jgi:acyl-CoA synthetase (AMP-forming)/AMP-acid ligase II
MEQFAERYGIEVINYFGSNEGAALSSTPQDVPDRHQRASYFPRVGVSGFGWNAVHSQKLATRLVDVESGEEIREPGRIGELRLGPMIFSGYFNSPELTARAFDELSYYAAAICLRSLATSSSSTALPAVARTSSCAAE